MSKRKDKIREEQEATAHVFQEFVESFQSCGSKTFVKATDDDENQNSSVTAIRSKPPTWLKDAVDCARILKENRSKPKSKSNLETLKEEMKLRYAERQAQELVKRKEICTVIEPVQIPPPIANEESRSELQTTTNLFVANLDQKTTEKDLMYLFGAFGPLASVKIMWPRNEMDHRRHANCGFVAFMSRKDAERALDETKYRMDMRVNWGKVVDLPQYPIYIPDNLINMHLPPDPSGLPLNAQMQSDGVLENALIQVTIPLNRDKLALINRMVEFVIREGAEFEALIMKREINNSEYSFLFDCKLPEHLYYRWRLFAILNGDSLKSWSMTPFRMFKGGPIWLPPKPLNFTAGMPDELINRKTKTKMPAEMSKAQFKRFKLLLRNLDLRRSKIGEAMVFCLDHRSNIMEILGLVLDSLKNSDTAAMKKLARLYLLSDTLHNLRRRNRTFDFEANFATDLLEVFNNLRFTAVNMAERDNFDLGVTKVLRFWHVCHSLSEELITKLECAFNLGGTDADSSISEDEPLDGASLLKRLKSQELDGEPVLEIEVEKEVEEVAEKLGDKWDYVVPSKWDVVDPGEVEAQAMSAEKLYLMEMSKSEKCEAKKARKKKDRVHKRK